MEASAALLALAKAAASAWLAALLAQLALSLLQRWRLRHLPGMSAMPLLGHLPHITKDGLPGVMMDRERDHGRVSLLWFGSTPWVLLTDAELVRKTSTRWLNRLDWPGAGLLLDEQKAMDDYGLVFAKAEEWRPARRAWEPAVTHPHSLLGYCPVMNVCARKLAARLEAAVEAGAEVDMWRELGRMTLAVVGTAAFGVDLHTFGEVPGGQQEQSPELQRRLQQGQDLIAACQVILQQADVAQGSAWVPLLMLLPAFKPLISRLANLLPGPRFSEYLAARGKVMEVCQQLIDDYRADRQGADSSFLNRLLDGRAGQSGADKLSDVQIIAQAFIFLLAGYETTANALAFTIHCLATHSEAEGRLLQELDALLAGKGGGPRGKEQTPELELGPEDLERLPYLEAVVSEALRLYPPAAITARVPAEDVQLGGHTVPAGTTVINGVYNIHRNPEYWPEPEAFKPERFLPGHESLGKQHPHAYLPFGAGARMCAGYKFAMQEAKLALAQLYSRFAFRLLPGQVPLQTVHGITLAPKGGVRCTVHRR